MILLVSFCDSQLTTSYTATIRSPSPPTRDTRSLCKNILNSFSQSFPKHLPLAGWQNKVRCILLADLAAVPRNVLRAGNPRGNRVIIEVTVCGVRWCNYILSIGIGYQYSRYTGTCHIHFGSSAQPGKKEL